MGFSTSIFLAAPDASLICSICQDVLEDPKSLRCGHSFCVECLRDQRTAQLQRLSNVRGRQVLDDKTPQPPCPTCRGPGGNWIPNFACKEMINSLHIRCKNVWENGGNGGGRDSGQRHRADDNDGSDNSEGRRVRSRLNNDAVQCNWTGRIDEWKRHTNEECCLHMISCDIPGCGAMCRRCDMSDHRRSDACIEARIEARVSAAVAAVEEKFAKEIADLKQKIGNSGSNRGRVLSFCRQWMIRKPDPLYDFVIYRNHVPHGCDDLSSLLVGVPGPLRTPWEGCLLPMLMEWKWGTDRPPRCRFPPGTHLPNNSPTGWIYVSNLNEEESWRPNITIPELLFSLQQIIAHPDVRSPYQAEAYHSFVDRKDEYDQIAREQARKYTPDRFLELAREAFHRAENLPSILVADSQQSPRTPPVEPTIAEDNKDPVQNRPCVCSCCAWGTATGGWDSNLEMRFLFCGSHWPPGT